MEVTKYYCEACGSEVGNGEWTKVELAITFRSKSGGCPDKIYSMKKICDDCIEGLGFPYETESNDLHGLTRKLSMKFIEVAKKLIGWKGDKNEVE